MTAPRVDQGQRQKMTVRAKISRHTAPLFSEFGLTYATKLFGQETIDDLPRYVRGPKKGQIKAWLVWQKAESGGWLSNPGIVVKPGLVYAWISGQPDGDTSLRAMWMGRVETLRGHRDVLSAAYREQMLRDRATPGIERDEDIDNNEPGDLSPEDERLSNGLHGGEG